MKRRALQRIETNGEMAAIIIRHKDGEDFRCLVDLKDVAAISASRSLSLYGARDRQYVQLTIGGFRIALHRFLLGLKPGDGRVADHLNGDGLDNRRRNLRAVTQTVNLLNRPTSGRRNCSSGIRGITAVDGKYDAELLDVYLGRFADIRDAIETIWLCLLSIDPHSAARYLRGLPQHSGWSCPDKMVPAIASAVQ